MQIENAQTESNSNEQNININDIKPKLALVRDLIDIIIKSAAIIGITIGILFFLFYAKALPNMDFASILSYAIAVSSVGILISIYIVCLLILPTMLFSFKNITDRKEKMKYIVLLIASSVVLSMAFVIITNAIFNFFAWKSDYAALSSIVLSLIAIFVVSVIITTKIQSIDWCEATFKGKFIPMFLFGFFSQAIFFILAVLFDYNTQDKVSFFVVLFVLLLILIIVNMVNADEINPIAKIATLYIASIIGTSIAIMYSGGFNPYIVSPFKELKLGYYYAKITLKDDYIDTLKDEHNKSLLAKSQCVFVLSSLGSEYIFQNFVNTKFEVNPNKPLYRVPKDKVLLEQVLLNNPDENFATNLECNRT